MMASGDSSSSSKSQSEPAPGTFNGPPPPPAAAAASKPSPCNSSEEGGPVETMHTKMCKKIAQLTKVIYALNTKQDEYEVSIQTLKEAHQEEIQQTLVQTKEAALQYKSQVKVEQELRKHIQTLEEALERHRKLKEEASAECTSCNGKQVEERQPPSQTERAGEERLRPKEKPREKLDFGSRTFSQDFKEGRTLEGETLDYEGALNGMYSMEMQAARISETETLKRENQELVADYAERADPPHQAAHKREKETWRKAIQQSRVDSCRELQQREMEQRKHYEAQEAVSRQQRRKLEGDLEAKGLRIGELKKYSQKLKAKLQDLDMQLKEAQQMTMESKSTVVRLEKELNRAKERLLLQENEKQHKTEAALNTESKASREVSELKAQIVHLQQALSRTHSQSNQVGGDSQARDPAGMEEEEAIKQQLKEELRKLKHKSEEEKMYLKEQLVKGLEDLVKKHALEMKSVKASMDTERNKLQKEVQTQLEELKEKYETEIRQLQKEKEVVNGKFQECSLEVLKLEEFIRQNQEIPKYAEFLKSYSRKILEKQQEDTLVQHKDLSNEHEETTQWSMRKEEKPRPDSADVAKRQERQNLASLQEKTKEAKALQEESCYEKSDQQTQEAEERWRKEYQESLKMQEQSHWLHVQAAEEKARAPWPGELERRHKQQAWSIERLRMELSEQRASCKAHKKEKEVLKAELKNIMAIKNQQEGRKENQIKSLQGELEKCQHEIAGLRKENALLKDSDEERQKQRGAQVEDREDQHRGLLEEDLKVNHKKELDVLKEDHHQEIQNMVSDFSSTKALLHAKIISLEKEIKELEERPRKRESRPDDLHLIGCLQEKLSEKEAIIKELLDGRKFQHSVMTGAEPHRNRSFSFNANPITCLTPTAKQKKKIDEASSRIVNVPNLASYAKSFLSGDLRPKRTPPQITKSSSLDQNPGCVRVSHPSAQAPEASPAPRQQISETSKPKDAQKQDPQHQEWFTKYFSF